MGGRARGHDGALNASSISVSSESASEPALGGMIRLRTYEELGRDNRDTTIEDGEANEDSD